MIGELAAIGLLAVAGFGLLALACSRISPWARAALALPTGSALYLIISLGIFQVRGSLLPALALITAGTAGVGCAAVSGLRGAWGRRESLALALLAIISGLVVIAARTVNGSILSPDSVVYLVISIQLQQADALALIEPANLMTRQFGYPALHALSAVTDLRYMATLGPAFGVCLLGLFGWFVHEGRNRRRMTYLAIAVGIGFLLSSNRFLYSWSYINSHIQVATYLFIAVGGAWLTTTKREPQWAIPLGLALASLVLLRPESPLFIAVILTGLAASNASRRARWFAAAPVLVATAGWYASVLLPHPAFPSSHLPSAPILGNVAAIALATVGVALGSLRPLRSLTRNADAVLVALMFGGLGFLAARDLEVLADSALATVANTRSGAWLFTWPVLVALTAVAVFRHRIPYGRIWTVSVLGFGLLYWILPLLRDGAWRIGTGDSGNRILIHLVAIVVAYVLLGASRPDDDSVATNSRSEPEPSP